MLRSTNSNKVSSQLGKGVRPPHEGEQPLALTAGDLVLMPHGLAYAIVDDPSTPTVPMAEVLEANGIDLVTRVAGSLFPGPRLSHGGGGVETDLICEGFAFDGGEDHPLLALLPRLILVRGVPARAWLASTLRFLAWEAHEHSTGAAAVVARLTDVIFIQVVRAWLETRRPRGVGWLGALRDKQIGGSIALMHRRPGADWTVASLAEAVGMSRSGYAARFHALVDEGPLTYLTRWRMHVAATTLTREPSIGLVELASRGVRIGGRLRAGLQAPPRPRAGRVSENRSRWLMRCSR